MSGEGGILPLCACDASGYLTEAGYFAFSSPLPSQEYPGAPAPTDEDSITFKSFLESLDKGLIAKVDFAAGGNKAYAFVKPSGGGEGEPTRIRVGEGYPDDQGNGWSSPLWVVRALNDRHVRGPSLRFSLRHMLFRGIIP